VADLFFRVLPWLLTFAVVVAQKPTGDKVSTRDGVYSTVQAERGERVYDARCSSCHQPGQFSVPAFLQSWNGRTADALFDNIRTTMPPENPGGLKRQEYADILAYLFQLNALPPGDDELKGTDDALKRVVIETPRSKGDRWPW
jgi:mono/diheme cytochrome c family protein